MKKTRAVYLDHAAATPLDPRVQHSMSPYWDNIYGNPSALHTPGRNAKIALDQARETVAKILNCGSTEIIFTGSGTESDNLAIFGIAKEYANYFAPTTPSPSSGRRGKINSISSPFEGEARRGFTGHIITTSFEHHAVLNPCKALEKDGYKVTYLKVDRDGLVTPEQLKAAIQPDTILISIMYANNEIGTIEPIIELTSALREKKKELGRKPNDPPFLHTDACQAAGYLELDVKKLGVDLMTINGSKIYGPKGTGLLFLRRGLRLEPIIYGGGQENKLRSGTENLAGIVGLAKALEIAVSLRERECTRLRVLRDQLIAGITEKIPKVELNGHSTQRLPNNVNVSILDIEGEAMLLYLDEYGIYASTGSACDSQSLEPSHVIMALGKSHTFAHGSIRFTLGRSTTEADIDYVIKTLPEIVKTLRKISPLNIKMTA